MKSFWVFWVNGFVLPAKVGRDFKRLLHSYISRGKLESVSEAEVAWFDVCLLCNEGGLNICHIPYWDIVTVMKLFVAYSGSPRVFAWVEADSLWDRSIWKVNASKSSSWCWLANIRVRDSLKSLVQYSIGEGCHCLVWFDLYV